jgi:hypothetical protein
MQRIITYDTLNTGMWLYYSENFVEFRTNGKKKMPGGHIGHSVSKILICSEFVLKNKQIIILY